MDLPAHGSVSSLVFFAGDWPEDERKRVIEVVEAIEWDTVLPAPPAGWTPWHVNRVVLKDSALYVAHRWHMGSFPYGRSLEGLLKEMRALAR